MEQFEERLKEINHRFQEVEAKLSQPEVVSNPEEYKKTAKLHTKLQRIVGKYQEYQEARKRVEEAKALIQDRDPDLAELARQEHDEWISKLEELGQELKVMLLPEDPNDERNVIMEIRAGAGGEEAALFAADLFRMYSRYGENHSWKLEVLNSHPTELGGFKEIIFSIQGDYVYSKMKFESGTHRVQRIPVTEAGGRIHTSTATVAVLPEPEEVEVEINPEDLRIDVYRASGPGGQHVNVTDSAVRITHNPTGLVVQCQDEKSQHKNRAKALKVLRARLFEMEQKRQQAEISQQRRQQIGTGDRSERVRTYNFPQNRLTDHRINLTLYKLSQIREGELEELLQALILEDQARKLKQP